MTAAASDDAMASGPLSALGEEVRALTDRSHVPFSEEPRAAGVLLADGRWVPGVRVESASFSLVIPALLNAVTTAVACDAPAPLGVALSRPARPDEKALLDLLPQAHWRQTSERSFARDEAGALPALQSALDPYLDAEPSAPDDAAAEARRLAVAHAHVPLSEFPVGCLLHTPAGAVPGVNVEYEDWTRTLCAERNALGTALSYASGEAQAMHLACPRAARSTPCGACRQLLLELAPRATVWMDRRGKGPESASPTDLLPGGFTGGFLSSV
ncbi:MAG: cytidine deaminase [Bacteroidetes bacterium QS_8_64_10]|nr:MAG: cytidine deaminase [Bacteroidetes bacterium QS_8_64_10]